MRRLFTYILSLGGLVANFPFLLGEEKDMAINNNFFTVQGVTNIANLGELYLKTAIKQMNEATQTSGLIPGILKKLQDVQDELLKERQRVLGILHAKDEDEIRARVNTFYEESGFNNFTGLNLATLTEGYAIKSDATAAQRRQIIMSFIKRDVPEAFNEVMDKQTQDDIVARILSLFQENIDVVAGSQKNYTRTTKFAQYDEKGILHILVGRLTKTQKAHMDRFISKQKNNNIFNNLQGIITEKDTYIQIGFSWYDITEHLTETQARKQLSKREVSNRNREMIKLILQMIDSKYHKVAQSLLQYMLKNNPYMFFVGEATTQITGILGEVGTLFAIDQLLGGRSLDKYTQWIATQKVNGKQLSIDVIFKEEGIPVGVQSKNTTLPPDLKSQYPITFASGRIELIFERLFGFEWTGFSNVLISNTFNVPYRKVGGDGKRSYFQQVSRNFNFREQPLPENFQEYVKQDIRMEQLSQDICLYLTQFAPNFLYMSSTVSAGNGLPSLLATLDNSLDVKGNFIYMVGKEIKFATEILQRIQDNLTFLQQLQNTENESENKIKSLFNLDINFKRFKDDSQNADFNIVDYYNKHIGSAHSLKDYGAILTSSMVL